MNRLHRGALVVAAGALACTAAPVLPTGAATAALAADGSCNFPAASIPGEPWALQRVLLSQLHAKYDGRGVTVAVVDSGVDDQNPQLKGAVKAGQDFLKGQSNVTGGSTTDQVGHGTMVAGVIAARPDPQKKTGFEGIAPGATILSIRQNDGQGSATEDTLAAAIDSAVSQHVDVINISQDLTDKQGQPFQGITSSSKLYQAVERALAANIVVVAAAGNENLDKPTYPAAIPGVIGVGASDRNDERADGFSETGKSVMVAAPGVDIVSTVPAGGQCVDSGTSFAAPYVAGVAALLRQEYPKWTEAQIATRIEQTALRTDPGWNPYIGWGVVDPVAAVTDQSPPADSPVASPVTGSSAAPVQARPFDLGETPQQRDERTALFAVGLGAVGLIVITGTATVIRDTRRRARAAR
ncbi:type VII secretion-associated serine protease mycosin [Streptacidiphilus pinicola]|uniref:Type VII secretion-associated serine protease mycosin n=1 Tax=Streptacidiphilus pinicola TaxID=2219663 RepID=A0A2X0KII7_9ACTN|nr:type VII secretion-associated serine protease mycosin [Streptacidiphilus pinicola]RAG86560.1 type VII secretion-associated serine protease mycosin [Streptacidiphilus pinicola]